MLLISQNDTFKISVMYRKDAHGGVSFLDKKPDEPCEPYETDWFEFRFPSWNDVRIIMSNATKNGQLTIESIDAISLMDTKVRTLLKAWSLKNNDGKTISTDQASRLPASMIVHLSSEIDKELGPGGLFGTSFGI